MNHDPGRPGKATDSLVVLAALVSLTEEYSSAFGGGVSRALGLLGFALDLVFVGLFCIRHALLRSDRGIAGFWGEDRNWIEFLASFPVLVLVSGPYFFVALSGGGNSDVAFVGLSLHLSGLTSLRLLRLLRFAERGRVGSAPLARAHLQKAVSVALCSTLAAAFLLESFATRSDLAALVAFAASVISLIVYLALVLVYGPFVLRSEEEAVALRDRLFERLQGQGAVSVAAEAGGQAGRGAPAGREEIEGLLSRASRYGDQGGRA